MSKGANTRELIVAKSAELFNVYGYHGCSLSDIMKATGLKKGGIYNHFKNKDEIALAAYDYSFQKILKRFRERLDQDKTSSDKLKSIIAVYKSFLYQPVIKGGCPVVNTAVDATDSHPELTQRSIEGIKTLHTYVTIKIDEGIANGEFKPVNSEEVATLILSTLKGAIVMSRINKEDQYMQTAARFLEQYIDTTLLA